MATVQTLVRRPRECFSYNDYREKTPIHSGKKPFFTNYVYSGLCNELKWLAGIDYLQREKNLKSCNLHKQAFLAKTQKKCFAYCIAEEFTSKHYFSSWHRMFVNLQPKPQKAGKVKSMEKWKCSHLPFPCKCERWKLHRVEKKIPRAGFYHFCKNF